MLMATHDRPTPQPRVEHRPRTLLIAGVCAAVVIGAFAVAADSAAAITRNSVLSRAQVRVDSPVKYSQTKYYAGYRTDCSGYVSMAWKTGTSWNTRTFHNVTHRIKVSQLQPGDAMLRKGYHIRLFYGWLDDARTYYVAYESADKKIAGVRIRSIADDLASGYVPVRYDRIAASPKSRNLLRNPSFNTWAPTWNGTELPVWWDTGGEWWEADATRRRDTFRTAKNSLQLTHPGDSTELVMLTQTTRVTPNVDYRVKGWVRAMDPSTVALSLTYLDSAGASVAETSTMGDRWGINSNEFKSMSSTLKAPANATFARVTIWLAPLTDAALGTPGPNVAILDDVSLYRPQVTAGIKTSKTSVKRGKSFTLGGTVTPTRTQGTSATLWTKKPGGSWKKLSTVKIGATGSSASWKKKVTISSKARKGTHSYRLVVPAVPGYLGATSKTVSVKVK